MEKIKVGKLLNRVVRDSKVYSLPFMTEIFELAESLAGIKICKNALMAIFRIGRGFWKICERAAATTGTAPKHALKGKENVRSKIFKQEIEPQLAEFFEDTVLTLSGPRPTRFAKEAGGDVEIRDSNNIQEFDLNLKSWIQSGPSSVFLQNTVGIWGIIYKVTLKEI
jgi:hypothetical protein